MRNIFNNLVCPFIFGTIFTLVLSPHILVSRVLEKKRKTISTALRLSKLERLPSLVTKTCILTFNENLNNAWNGSLIEHDNKYLLVFRHTTSKSICNVCAHKEQQLKMVYLDYDFKQVSPIKTILANACSPEDARLHYVNGELFLTYNDYVDLIHTHPFKVCLYVGKLDPESGILIDSKPVPSAGIKLKQREKNWVPFVYPEQGGIPHYIYSTTPYKIIKCNTKNSKEFSHLYRSVGHNVQNVWQEDIWGEIRGGTPACLVDGVYLTFFHAMRRCPVTKHFYYVMGAYIFSPEPPFHIYAITPNPIVFNDMYTSRHRSVHHIIYPTGFVIEKKGDKEYIHVSCGENDMSTRIVTIDKDVLFKSMVPIKSGEARAR